MLQLLLLQEFSDAWKWLRQTRVSTGRRPNSSPMYLVRRKKRMHIPRLKVWKLTERVQLTTCCCGDVTDGDEL